MVHSDWTQCNGQKLKQRKLHLDIIKVFFTLKAVKHQNGLPGGAVGFPSLEILKAFLDMVLGNLHQLTLLWAEGTGNLQRPLPTSAVLWYILEPYLHRSARVWDSTVLLLFTCKHLPTVRQRVNSSWPDNIDLFFLAHFAECAECEKTVIHKTRLIKWQ